MPQTLKRYSQIVEVENDLFFISDICEKYGDFKINDETREKANKILSITNQKSLFFK